MLERAATIHMLNGSPLCCAGYCYQQQEDDQANLLAELLHFPSLLFDISEESG